MPKHGGVIAHAPEAILDIAQVAEWLQVSTRTVERLDIPCVFLGTRTKRFLGRDVLAYLERRKAS
jgi:hypothetical protein